MLETTEQGGTTGGETPTGAEAQATAQAQAGATEQGGATQSEAGTQQVERPGYLDSMPDTHKNNEALFQFKTPGDLADAALKSLEKQEFKPPGPDAEPEEIANWRTLTGVPTDPNGYEFSKPEDLPAGMSYNEEKAAAFAKECHEKGISKEHARYMFDRYNGEMAEMFKAQDEALKNSIAANKKKLEEQHKSGFEEVMKQSDEIVFRLGGSEFLQGLESEGLKTDVLTSPTMINLFLKLKTAVISDSSQPGPGGGKGTEEVPRDARGHAEFSYESMPESQTS
jgi:hypothetical protein